MKNILTITKNGMGIKFEEKDLRKTQRGEYGIFAMKIKEKDSIVKVISLNENNNEFLLTITKNGFLKISLIKDIKVQKRAGIGIKIAGINEKTGIIVDAISTKKLEKKEVLLITKKGIIIRFPVKLIRVMGRLSIGIKAIKIKEKDEIVSINLI